MAEQTQTAIHRTGSAYAEHRAFWTQALASEKRADTWLQPGWRGGDGAGTYTIKGQAAQELNRLAADPLSKFTLIVAAAVAVQQGNSGQTTAILLTPPLEQAPSATPLIPIITTNDPSGSLRDHLVAVAEVARNSYRYQDMALAGIAEQETGQPIARHSNLICWVPGLHAPPPAEPDLQLKITLEEEPNIELIDPQSKVALWTMEQFITDMERVLCAFADHAQPYHQIMRSEPQNEPSKPKEPQRNVVEQFRAVAAAHGTRIALQQGEQNMTYAELEAKSDRLARQLTEALGARPETPVGVLADRNMDMVIAVLAVLKSGASWLPLEPDHTRARIDTILQDSGATILLLSTEELLEYQDAAQTLYVLDHEQEEQNDQEEERVQAQQIEHEHNAYLIYTSGSTGTPKGCAMTHGNLAHYLDQVHRIYLADGHHHVPLFTTTTFDFTITSMLGTLTHGSTLHLYSSQQEPIEVLANFMAASHPVDVAKMTPAHIALLEYMPEQNNALKRVIVGGEAMTLEQVKQLRKHSAEVEIYNEYGPTEATVGSIVKKIEPHETEILIGTPIPGMDAHVINPSGAQLPPGIKGQLVLSGAGLARGYHGRPGQTAAQFVPTQHGQRHYLTGDQARRMPEGPIASYGRLDDQVKIRGYRIEPAEVAAELSKHPAIKEAVVRPHGHGTALKLVAFVTLAAPLEESELRRWATEQMPAPQHPRTYHYLEQFPQESRGKIDRAALDRLANKETHRKTEPPQTETQQKLREIWREVFERQDIGITDNFFELGGHSLLAAQIAARIQDQFRVELWVQSLFEAPSILELEAIIAEATPAEESKIKPTSQDRKRLSIAQRRMWIHSQMKGPDSGYNMPEAIRLRGRLAIKAVEASTQAIMDRHENIRTRIYEEDGEPYIEIEPNRAQIHYHELSHLDTAREQAARHVEQEQARPFDLKKGSLIRIHLIRIAAEEHIMTVNMHHIISDGWSLDVLIREFSQHYAAALKNEPAPLPPLAIQYSDYANWQRSHHNPEQQSRQLAYWAENLKDLKVAEIPAARTRPSRLGNQGASRRLHMSKAFLQTLKNQAKQQEATLFMALLAPFYILQAYLSGKQDLTVGTEAIKRNRTELEPIIGFFLNQLVLRVQLDPSQSYSDLLAQVRTTVVSAFANDEVPFDTLVAELPHQRDPSRTPYFQTVFILVNRSGDEVKMPGLEVTTYQTDHLSVPFELAMKWQETDEGIGGELEYNTDLYEASHIDRILAQYKIILESVAQDPTATLATHQSKLRKQDKAYRQSQRQQFKKAGRSLFRKIRTGDSQQPEKAAAQIKSSSPYQKDGLPRVIEPSHDGQELVAWGRQNRAYIEQETQNYGALLFRNFSIGTVAEFNAFVEAVSGRPDRFLGESSPRSQVQGNIFTSTDYPADKHIFPHNEFSYNHTFPAKVFFYCDTQPEQGGETPLVNSRKVLKRIPETIRKRFAEEGWSYVRNYSKDIGIPWQKAFGSSDREVVHNFCRENKATYEWKTEDQLRINQKLTAQATHPKTGEQTWFNHGVFFHVTTLDPIVRQGLQESFAEEELPNNTYYGNGKPIEPEVLEILREAYRQETVLFPWQKGDVLLVDNILTSHGRTPYLGQRKILVALTEPLTRDSITGK